MAKAQLKDSIQERKDALWCDIEISFQNTFMKNGSHLAEEEANLKRLRAELADLEQREAA